MSTARDSFIRSVMRRKMRRCESSEKSSEFELFGSLGVGGVVEQDGAEDGLFGIDIGRQSGVKRQIGDGGHEMSLGRRLAVQNALVFGNLEKTARAGADAPALDGILDLRAPF